MSPTKSGAFYSPSTTIGQFALSSRDTFQQKISIWKFVDKGISLCVRVTPCKEHVWTFLYSGCTQHAIQNSSVNWWSDSEATCTSLYLWCHRIIHEGGSATRCHRTIREGSSTTRCHWTIPEGSSATMCHWTIPEGVVVLQSATEQSMRAVHKKAIHSLPSTNTRCRFVLLSVFVGLNIEHWLYTRHSKKQLQDLVKIVIMHPGPLQELVVRHMLELLHQQCVALCQKKQMSSVLRALQPQDYLIKLSFGQLVECMG